MYKNRDVRRSFNRPTNKKLISGIESRGEKIKRLSTAVEMASDGGGSGDNEQLSASAIHRKLKFSRKNSCDLNTVDHASVVPRKLRSAVKKRSCGSTLLPLREGKKSNNSENVGEPLRKDDGFKKSKQKGYLDRSLERVPSMPISKDEEEVAKTLFALAGLIPLSDLKAKNKMNDESSEAKASDMKEKHKKSMLVSRVPEEDQAITSTLMTNREENSLIGPKLSERRSMNLKLRVSVPPVNPQKIPQLLRTCDQRSSMSSTFFHTLIEPSPECGLNEIKQEKAFIFQTESLIRTEAIEVENQHATVIERRHNGVSVTSRVFCDSGIDGLHLQSAATTYPSWLCTNTSSSRVDKLLSSMSGRTSWKRCAVHVHISRLIKAFQISEEKDTQPVHMISSSDCKNPHEGANVIPLNYRYDQLKQQDGPSFSGCCVSKKKQSFDFLSLSSRVTPAVDDGVNRWRNTMEAGENGYVVYQHSVVQHGRTIPFSLQQNYLPSNPFCDQVSALSVGPPHIPLKGHLRGAQYLSNPFAPAHVVSMMRSAQQPQAEEICSTQFRPGPQLASHITNWQNRR